MIQQPLATPLGNLGLEALDNLPLMVKQGEIGKRVGVNVVEAVVDLLGTDVAGGGFQEHGLVETTPDVLGGVDKILDSAGDSVSPGSAAAAAASSWMLMLMLILIPQFGGGSRGEGVDGVADGGDVSTDGLGGGVHEDDGVGGINEIAVSIADQLPKLLILVLDLLPGRRLHIPDFGDGLRSEEGFGIFVPSSSSAILLGAGVGGW